MKVNFEPKTMTGTSNKPYLLIQSDWEDALMNEEGRVWVTCKIAGQPGTRGVLAKAESVSNMSATGKFRVLSLTKKFIEVSHQNPDCKCKFYAPQTSLSGMHLKSITCLDVSSGGLGISTSVDDKLVVWDTERGIIRRQLDGHFGEVYTCRFFPSGIVILSGGSDMRLKIWSAETGQCPVTLKGHKGAILDTAIVERGRNVISVSRDGTAKLWDCGQSSCLTTIADVQASINGCALSPVVPEVSLGASKTTNEREIGTQGKVLLMACEDKFLRAAAVQSRDEIFCVPTTSAVNCCAFMSSSQLACGTDDGRIYIHDIRNSRTPLHTWVHSAAVVHSILPFENGLFASYGDGLCQFTSPLSGETIQLTGSDCDPVYKIVCDNAVIYTCCRDGMIRKYKVDV